MLGAVEGTDPAASGETDDLLEAARMSRDAASTVVLARLRQQLFAATDLPTVGRYVLVREIGSGGMGVVYEARDPKLQRAVAIKLIRPRGLVPGSEASARALLLREARSMAALSHPNVLPIYDVGTEGRDVFLAMELVHGSTLRQWLRARTRSMDEIVSVLASAGHGLQAAHAAGLVHRDFKPSNVLVADGGRVFVMDFGLARGVTSASGGPTTSPDRGGSVSGDTSTQTGFAVGSPAYMSPQQHRGARPDPKADQWSFCVALHEAVYGALPFAETTIDALRVSIDRGLGPLPKGPVPANVRRVIRTGLRADPQARFSTMAELLAVLQPRARGRGVRWAGAIVVAGGAAAGLVAVPQQPAGGCDDALERGHTIWNDARRAELAAHAQTSAPPWAPHVLRRTLASIDGYHAQWAEQQQEVCHSVDSAEAALVSARLRTACLRTRVSGLGEALGVLGDLDGRAAVRAPSTIATLPRLADCDAIDRLADSQRPGDPSDTPAAAGVVRGLQRAQALRSVGEYSVALSTAVNARTEAEAMGATRLSVQLMKLMGSLYGDLGRFDESAAVLEEAVHTAEAAHLDREAARAAIVALFTEARAARLDEAKRWAGFARAKLETIGDDGTLRSELLVRLSDAADMQGDYPEAERLAVQAQALAKGVRDPYGYASTLLPVARAHSRAGRLDAAQETQRAALRIVERSFGPDHPEALKIRGSMAALANRAGDHAWARDEIEATLPQLRAVYGDRSQPVALALGNLSSAYRGLGESERGLAINLEALAMRREVLGDGQRVALNLYNVGAHLAEMGRLDESIATYQESIEMWSASAGATHPMLLHPLEGLAEVLLLAERPGDAATQLERAMEVHEANETPEARRVLWNFYSAQVAWAQGDQREGARLAQQAVEMNARSGAPPHRIQAIGDTVETWLRDHPVVDADEARPDGEPRD